MAILLSGVSFVLATRAHRTRGKITKSDTAASGREQERLLGLSRAAALEAARRPLRHAEVEAKGRRFVAAKLVALVRAITATCTGRYVRA